nr:hypothetical protein [Tanacetum cinerariifolium]
MLPVRLTGVPTLPLFRSPLTIGPAGDWLTFQKRDVLQKFMKKPGQTPTFSMRPVNQPIDVDNPSMDRSKPIDDNDQEQSVSVAEGSKKKRSITATLEEGATVIKLAAVGVRNEHEMSKLKASLSKARKNQDVESSQVVKDLRLLRRLRPSVKDAEHLRQRCRDLETEMDFLLSKEFEEIAALSFKLKIADLKREFKAVKDYHPNAENICNEDAEAFYKLEFPYISLLVEKAGQSLRELTAVDPPTIQEATSM